jgi:hypothetical protein
MICFVRAGTLDDSCVSTQLELPPLIIPRYINMTKKRKKIKINALNFVDF